MTNVEPQCIDFICQNTVESLSLYENEANRQREIGNMSEDIERLLDETGWRILSELQQDARLSYSELGQRVNLSAPAVSERVRKMEEAGVITGYHAEVNRAKVGLPMTAIIRMGLNASQSSAHVIAKLRDIPEVIECTRVTGGDTLILKVCSSSIEHLESLIDRLLANGPLTTSMVLSVPIKRQVVTRELISLACRK